MNKRLKKKKTPSLYWANITEILKHVEHQGRVRCGSLDCAFYNHGNGCFLATGTLIVSGQCECYNPAPISTVFPRIKLNEEMPPPGSVPDSPDKAD